MTRVRSHTLKVWPGPYEALRDGRKRHEFRKDDRGGFKVGEELHLREWDPDTREYSNRKTLRFRITYVGRGFGIPDGYVVMSVERIVEVRRRAWKARP